MAVTEAFFQQFTQPRMISRYRTISGSCRWEIEGGGGWNLELNQGVLSVNRGKKKQPDCTITCSQQDFDRLVKREQNPFTAFLQGRVVVTGDMGLAQLCIRFFLAPDHAASDQEKEKGDRH